MKINLPVTDIERVLDDRQAPTSKTDLKGIITYANRAFVEISGFSKEELVGKPHNVVRHPDMPPAAFAALWNTVKSGRTWVGMVKNRCKNGDFYWVSATVTPTMEGGEITGYISVRRKPSRAQIEEASGLYRRMNAGKEMQPGQAGSYGKFGMLKNLTIKARLIFVIAFLSLLLAGIGMLGMSGMGKANENMSNIYEMHAVGLSQISDIRALMLRNRLAIAAALANPAPEVIAGRTGEVEKNIVEISRIWESYALTGAGGAGGGGHGWEPEEKRLAERFAESRGKFVAEGLLPAVTALRARDLKEAARIAEKVHALYQPVGEDISALDNAQLDGAKSEYGMAKERYETFRAISIASILFGVSLAAWIGFLLMRAVVRPINEAVAVADAVASGDLTGKIEVATTDEIGHLMLALKGMNDQLSGLAGNVRASADSIRTGASEIAAGNNDLSRRTQEQAASLEETAASMEELTTAVKQNAGNAMHARQLTKGASEIAAKGGQVVGQVVGTMGSISESSKKIVDIISVIDGIAFQTNILALNAAVEAARAGEQGRGFAVVASEVRNLAQRSAAAAKEIKALIGDSAAKVENGARLVAAAGKTMEEIVGAVTRVTDIMAEISAASSEQSAGIEQISRAVTQMDEATQQNAALVEQAAAAAESLEEEAQHLSAATGAFKLDQGDQPQARLAPVSRPAVGPDAGRALAAPEKRRAAAKALPEKASDDEWKEF